MVKTRLKDVPIWPSLITCAALGCGFLAIVFASWAGSPEQAERYRPDFPALLTQRALLEYAAWLVFAAMVLDGIDGRIARLTHQTTAFGEQLDSLADAVSFGVAPAFLAWQATVQSAPAIVAGTRLSHLVMSVCMIYVIATVIRLARFNVETMPDEWAHRYFKGLPSPAAAGLIASLVLLHLQLADAFAWVGRIGVPVATFGAALLMVSRVRYVHVMTAAVSGSRSVTYFVMLILLLTVAIFAVHYSLALAFVVYTLSGLWGLAYEKVAERIELMEEEGSFF